MLLVFNLSAAPSPNLTMALRSKSAYSACSAVKLCLIIDLYDNNTHQKICFVVSLEAQEQSQRQIAMVKLAILRSRGPHGTQKQGLANLISQDPSMGPV